MISVQHLAKCFGDLWVLKDINVEIRKGEVISIIGPSGTGKSTFLRCLNGLETPTSGEIYIDGINICDKSSNISKVRQKMGMVFQSFNLFNNMTVLENCMSGSVKVLRKSKSEAKATAIRNLRKVGMAPYINALPSQLSGGQKQRVAIARALSMNPEVLLFDEPTSALDPELTGEILNVIRALARERITMVIVTHEMAFARDVADRVVFMDGGVIVEAGPPEQVIDDPQHERTRRFLEQVFDR